ncbi:MAG: hypothetical protein K6F34_06230 [Lachnospiraceae bacterium]|nr:hypothetical protein [Lachnospiraceae bacterium]
MHRTYEIKKRQIRFAAFVLTLLIGLMPAVSVWALEITAGNAGRVRGRVVNVEETIKYEVQGTGGLTVLYDPEDSGEEQNSSYEVDGYYNVASGYIGGHDGFKHWKVKKAEERRDEGYYLTLTLTPVFEGSGDGGEDEEEEAPRKPVDPNAICAYYLNKDGNIDNKAKFGRQAQGPVCAALFQTSRPSGWSEGFSFSMSYEDKNTFTLKDGTLVLYIPGPLQKPGRQYAVMAADQNGTVRIYQNTVGKYPYVFTSKLDVCGYAFDVIYKD